MTHTLPDRSVSTLIEAFVAGQLAGDADRLAGLLTADFMLVGPLGYVVERDTWLQQYRSGALRQSALALEEPRTRIHDGAAIVIANQIQTTTYHDRDASGAFRVTLIAVLETGRWRLAGMHLSQMPPDRPPEHG